MVRLIKSVADENKKHAPFVVSKSIDTSHNIVIALQETKSLALLKSKRKKPVYGFKTSPNEFQDIKTISSKKCSLTNVKKDLKQMQLVQSDEIVNDYLCQEKSTICPFLTPLKLKMTREISYSENDESELLQQNWYSNGDDFNISSTISSPLEGTVVKTVSNPCDLENVWAEFMSNLENNALMSTKICSCISRKNKKFRTKLFADNFQGNDSIGSSLISDLAQDKYWQMKEIYKRASNEKKPTGIDLYEETEDMLQNVLNHSKSEQLKRCMYEIKQLHDSLKNKI